MRFSALGDVAMTLPPLYDACRTNPDKRFILLTKPHPAEMFVNPPENLLVITPDLRKYKGVGGLFRLYRELRRDYDISAVADLHDVLRTKILRFFFSSAGVKVAHLDKQRRRRALLTSKRHKHLLPLTPVEQCYRETFRKIGCKMERHFTSLFPSTPSMPDIPAISETMAMVKASHKTPTLIAIAPFAQHKGKIYPAEQMAIVIRRLSGDPSNILLIFGFGEEESAVIETWNQNQRILNMAALKLGIKTELAILANCDKMLSMDSANMHFAGLVGLPTVSVWGTTHPYAGFQGRTAHRADAVQLQMTCRPCSVYGNRPCLRGDYHCLTGISPTMILDALQNISQNPSPTKI